MMLTAPSQGSSPPYQGQAATLRQMQSNYKCPGIATDLLFIINTVVLLVIAAQEWSEAYPNTGYAIAGWGIATAITYACLRKYINIAAATNILIRGLGRASDASRNYTSAVGALNDVNHRIHDTAGIDARISQALQDADKTRAVLAQISTQQEEV